MEDEAYIIKVSARNDLEELGRSARVRIRAKDWLRFGGAKKGSYVILLATARSAILRKAQGARYFATAFLQECRPDPNNPERLLVSLSDYWLLPSVVSVSDGDFRWEDNNVAPRNRPAEQRSIRPIEFEAALGILRSGMSAYEHPQILRPETGLGFFEKDRDVWSDQDRRRIQRTVSERERKIRKITLEVDEARCVVSRMQIEYIPDYSVFEAMHLMSVGENGPDDITNLALVHKIPHALYGCFAYTILDDHRLLWADERVRVKHASLFCPSGRAHFEHRGARQQPSRLFLRWHQHRFADLNQINF